MTQPIIVWFRQDLRLIDNPALTAAAKTRSPIIPLYILNDETPGSRPPGGAARWWLHKSLESLAADLQRIGSRLILRRGDAEQILGELIADTGASAVYWNRCYEPFAITRDAAIKTDLRARGVGAISFNSALLTEPWELETKTGGPYRVFTPYWRAVTAKLEITSPAPKPTSLCPTDVNIATEELADWGLVPTKPDWAGGLRRAWSPGETSAQTALETFVDEILKTYVAGRDRPAQTSTSKLSPHLHWGEIGPRQIWAALDHTQASDNNVGKFKSELGWREFSYHLLYAMPHLPDKNLRPEFDNFPWQRQKDYLHLWQQGKTGFPIIDAGMRQLWQTGWMHNRVRMITASFLVKHLLQPWQDGAEWFWDTLVDADLASNSASWQWVAGCGADAVPYFRIFNPVLQGEKFDTDGDYVRHWVPELADVPDRFVHKPWQMPAPPQNYPTPIVDLAAGRARALAAYKQMKAQS